MMTNSKISEEVVNLLELFSDTESLEQRLNALVKLIKERALHAVRDDKRFEDGMRCLGILAVNSQSTEERLRTVSALARIGAVKSLSKKARQMISKALERPLPAIMSIKDPDERYYLARALHVGEHAWIIKYSAAGVVEEKQAEKARQELVSVLFDKSETLADIFRELVTEIREFKPETKNPGDSVAKRLERIIAAIRPLAVSVLIEPGNDIGNLLQEFLRSAFYGARKPETPDVAIKALEEVAGLVHDIARTQLSLVADPSLYSVLKVPKSWFSSPEWRYVAERSPNVKLVSRDIREAITLLAKQGTTDLNLFEQLTIAAGTRDAAVTVTKLIADQHPELDADAAGWLRGGGKLRRNTSLVSMGESQELSADPFLATMMIDGCQLRDAMEGISEDTQMELRLLEPEISESITTVITRCRAVLNDIDVVARKRNLTFRGAKGEVVEYSKAIHELVGGHATGVRQVKILQPMIIRDSTKDAGSVVRKALVERA